MPTLKRNRDRYIERERKRTRKQRERDIERSAKKRDKARGKGVKLINVNPISYNICLCHPVAPPSLAKLRLNISKRSKGCCLFHTVKVLFKLPQMEYSC